MGHNISAIILKGEFNESKSKEFDLIGIGLGDDLTMFHINHFYSACWQAKLGTKGVLDINDVDYGLYPCEMAISVLMTLISNEKEPIYSIISTDYFGGIGNQYANVYRKQMLADSSVKTINEALSFMGASRKNGMDEFDSVGLSNHRSEPEYLEKYYDLADELGV
jgi:hypothetical protein